MARNKFIIEMKHKYMSESDSEVDECPDLTNEDMKALVGCVLERGQECAKKFVEFKRKKVEHREFWREICSVLPKEKIDGCNLSDIYKEIRDRVGGGWVLFITHDTDALKNGFCELKITCKCKNPIQFFGMLSADDLFKETGNQQTSAAAMIYYTAYPQELDSDVKSFLFHIRHEISVREKEIEKFERAHTKALSIYNEL